MDSWIPCKGSDSVMFAKHSALNEFLRLTSWFEVLRLEKKWRHRTRISLDRDEVSLGKCAPSVSYIRSARPRRTERCTLCIHTGTRDHTRSAHTREKPRVCALPITHRAHCSLFFCLSCFFLCEWNPLWNEQHGVRVAGVSRWKVKGRLSQMKRMIVRQEQRAWTLEGSE